MSSATVKATLAAGEALTALVGDRIHPHVPPAGEAVPYVTYQRVSWPHEYTQNDTATARPRYLVSCWSKRQLEAEAVALAVRRAFRGAGFVDDGSDTYEPDTKLYGVRLYVTMQTTEEL